MRAGAQASTARASANLTKAVEQLGYGLGFRVLGRLIARNQFITCPILSLFILLLFIVPIMPRRHLTGPVRGTETSSV